MILPLKYTSILALLVQVSFAATLQVTTLKDEDDGSADPGLGTGLSLREAISYGAEGDTIVFAASLSGATITLENGQIQVDKLLEIDGSALDQAVILRGSDSDRLLEVVEGGDLTIRSVILENGYAFNDDPGNTGGAIRAAGALKLVNCLLRNNQGFFGGAISIHDGATVQILNTTFYENEATAAGGAILNDDSVLILEHSTLTKNHAAQGGGIWMLTGEILLGNSIVAGNSASVRGADIRITGTINVAGVNVLSTLDDSGLSAGSAVIVADARLAPLANYGGPTPSIPPLPGSPAIDAATSSTMATDQRGAPRPAGTARDIGAVEAHFYTVTTMADASPGSLREGLSLGAFTTAVQFDPSLNGATLILTEGELSSTRSLAISGYGLSEGLTIDANGAFTNNRVLRINAPHTIFMEYLTLRGGQTTGINSNDHSGGGLLNRGNLIMQNCHITANYSSQHGGGIEHQGNLLRVVDSTVNQNTAQKDGGGISGRFANRIEVLRSTLSGNEGASGGGIALFQTTLDLTACSLIENHARTDGGGAYLRRGGFSSARNSTFARNFAAKSGGGIFSFDNTSLILEHCTIANNESIGAGGGIWNADQLTLANTVIGDNQAGETNAREIYEHPSNSQIKLVGVNCVAYVGSATSLTAGPQLIVAAPNLGPLGNYGGSTLTKAPLPNSPLIDVGGTTELMIDQSGESRIKSGTADIGAVEYEAAITLPLMLAVNSDGDGIPFGVKDALGLTPGIANAGSSRLLSAPLVQDSGALQLSFMVNPSPLLPLKIILERASTLNPADFQEIYRYNPNSHHNESNGIEETRDGETILLNDTTPPVNQAFYRLKVELDL